MDEIYLIIKAKGEEEKILSPAYWIFETADSKVSELQSLQDGYTYTILPLLIEGL